MILVGVDVGGTFTDLILANTDAATVATHKLPTTSPDPSAGVVAGVKELCSRERVPLATVDYLFHGTTVATNAMLEHNGARTGMITTRGYRDIIHIGRHQRPQNYSIMQDIPWQSRPLVQRRHRKVVSERLVPPAGDVLVPLDEVEVRDRARELKAAGVEAVAICFLFSYLNPAHEQRVRALVEEEFPGAFVTTSAEVSPQFREFERFTTACMNAFLGPKVKAFVCGLERRLRESGVQGDVHIMTSNGGVATSEMISTKPVYSLLSGLAAGVQGGNWVGSQMRRAHMITFDVGGTSADIGIITPAGIAEASPRDTRIAGYPVMVPMIDVHTIGAGGGSIAYVDSGGAFRVGPRSAGSQPGPACYGQGGEEPTVTDANVVLGRLERDYFLGGAMNIFPERSFHVIEQLGRQLGLDIYQTADGINTILASNMANAIRSRTVQKGHDPRQFSLIAFGGAGPMMAVQVAEYMKIPEVVVPVYPGITSAMGLLTSSLKYDFTRTELLLSTASPAAKLNRDIAELQREAELQLLRDGIRPEHIQFARSLDLRYFGQGYELRVPIGSASLDDAGWESVSADFHRRHAAEYGHAFPGTPIEIVSLRVSGIGLIPKLAPGSLRPSASSTNALLKTVDTHFRVDGELRTLPTRFLDRTALSEGITVDGPAVLVQKDTTTVVPPGWQLHVAASGDLILTRAGKRRAS